MSAARPRGALLALALLTTGAAGATTAPATATDAPSATVAGKPKYCKTRFAKYRTAQLIRVRGVNCTVGRRVAETLSRRVAHGGCIEMHGRKPRLVSGCHRLGYRCTYKPIVNGLALDATCLNGRKDVRFQY